MRIYQVDAFTTTPFAGNPAAVCPLQSWPSDELLQHIAIENNLSETAFYCPEDANYRLRWFTPGGEVDLCGHATLATAFILYQEEHVSGEIVFLTHSGELRVSRSGDLLEMDFPAYPIKNPKENYPDILGIADSVDYCSAEDLLIELKDEEAVEKFEPDLLAISKLPFRGLIVTARSDTYDFVSRFFAPKYNIPEDPVTGSAHCLLAPYWSTKLEKNEFNAYQASSRGGHIICEFEKDRVRLKGKAVKVMEGNLVNIGD